jgi:hypothetical protein
MAQRIKLINVNVVKRFLLSFLIFIFYSFEGFFTAFGSKVDYNKIGGNTCFTNG